MELDSLNKLNPRCLKKSFCILLLAVLTLPLQTIGVEKIESTKVISVVDGDTLKVNYKGKEESVRLIGIDAPESRPNEKAKNDAQRSGEDLKTITAMGKETTKFVKTIIGE
jgi:micrococcal nuclease